MARPPPIALYDPARHIPLEPSAWDPSAAASFIRELFADTEVRCAPPHAWRMHPDDAAGKDSEHLVLYFGAAGVAWSQSRLAALGYGEIANDYASALDGWWHTHLQRLGEHAAQDYRPGLLLGEAGFLVAQLEAGPSAEATARLARLALDNADNAIREFMWGAPGTLVAAMARTKDAEKAAHATVDALEASLTTSPSLDCATWRQRLYGQEASFVGAVHGFAGNAYAVMRAADRHPAIDRSAWAKRIRSSITAMAVEEGGLANWPAVIDGDEPPPDAMLVQFCHGAPGVICAMAPLMDGADPAFDDLMRKGGELTWRAGPLAKGASVCHGTAGNGYAFLALFRATGDELWLERARRFAMTAIAQARAARAHHGQYRYSLWTGDHGLALYLHDCIRGLGEVPTFDTF